MKSIILSAVLAVMLSATTFAQLSVAEREKELAGYARAKNWSEVMMGAVDLITEEPLKPHGYYYAALAFYSEFQVAQASAYLENVFVFGDRDWKDKARELTQKITHLQEKMVGLSNFDVNSRYAKSWRKLWEIDDSNINAGIRAVELFIDDGDLLSAVEILDHESMADVPGVSDLKQRLTSNPQVSRRQKIQKLISSGDSYFAARQFTKARQSYEEALAMDNSVDGLSRKVHQSKEEEAWAAAVSANRVEAYETYYKEYGYDKYKKEARAKIVDYLRARIERYAGEKNYVEAESNFKKYVETYKPSREELIAFEKILCKLYGDRIFALSAGKTQQDKQQKLDIYYKAREICQLTEAQKKEISKLEKSLR